MKMHGTFLSGISDDKNPGDKGSNNRRNDTKANIIEIGRQILERIQLVLDIA
jgi:hypothetical protein